MNNCGKDCPLKQAKGCSFSDKHEPNHAKDSNTPFIEYHDPDFSIEGCPVDVARKYKHVWDFCIDMVNSKTFFLPDMPFLQAFIYNTFIIDRNVVIEFKNKNRGNNG